MEYNKIGDWVIYRNNQLIAFNKPCGLPAQPDKTGEMSLLQLAEIFCKHPVHLVHRIDRPASGIVLFAKTKPAMVHLNEQFHLGQVGRKYLAVVKDHLTATSGSLVHYLTKNGRTNKTAVSKEAETGSQEARLEFRNIARSEHYCLLEVEISTGRHHQIRAQLAEAGMPIKGDVKYGYRRSNPDRSIHLHAWKLDFQHPVSGERVEITAEPPLHDKLWSALLLPANSSLITTDIQDQPT
jgi:23S rRNA pseudouridine1911/1915/1917 synthase